MTTETTNEAYKSVLDSIVAPDLQDAETKLAGHARGSSIPDNELAENLTAFQTVRALKRQLYLHELYRQILPVHGAVMQFGVRWGRDLAAFEGFRTIYEPFNASRVIIGFDTFEGFPSVHAKDGGHSLMVEHGLSTAEGYFEELSALMAARRGLDPLPHLVRGELRRGDVVETLPAYLAEHPETIVAFAHFDLDLYAPTKACLEAITPHLTKGSVVAFDELNSALAPGETEALREVWGLSKYRIQRLPTLSGHSSFLVID